MCSQKDVDSPERRPLQKVRIDLGEQLRQEIGTAVHVSDGIRPDAPGRLALVVFGASKTVRSTP
jgi:hypothetical protein